METKNRMIRAEDALWTRVTKSASKLGRSASEFVRQSLWRATDEKLCFLCGNPAIVENRARIGRWAEEETIAEMAARNAAGDASVKPYSDVAVAFAACAAHEPGSTDYFLDHDLQISGYSIVRGDTLLTRRHVGESDAAYVAMAEIVSRLTVGES